MSGVNKVILIGNLGDDVQLNHFDNGDAVANLSVATSEKWKDKNSGEMREKTEWHRVVMFRRLAEIAAEYLHKGSKVYVEGKLQTRKYQKDGVDHYTTEIVAHTMQMLDSRGESGTTGTTRQASQQAAPPVPEGFDDDDIPFANPYKNKEYMY